MLPCHIASTPSSNDAFIISQIGISDYLISSSRADDTTKARAAALLSALSYRVTIDAAGPEAGS